MAALTIAQILQDQRANKRVKPIDLVEPNPELASLVSKFVPSEEPNRYDKRGNREVAEPQVRAFRNVSQHTAQNIDDADMVMNILTDMDLCKQILVSATLSPKDMGDNVTLRYSGPDGFFSPTLHGSVLGEIQRHFEEDYKICEYLPKILGDMYFDTGSYAVAALPENSIDEVINSNRNMSFEDFSEYFTSDGVPKPMGCLGPATLDTPLSMESHSTGLSLEGYRKAEIAGADPRTFSQVLFNDPEFVKLKAQAGAMLTVTDNLATLQIPLVQQRLREEAVMSIHRPRNHILEEAASASFESYDDRKVTDRQLDAAIYGQRKSNYRPIVAFRTQEQLSRYSVGEPLVQHFPSESVIPVFIPGAPERQVGFFVLTDTSGHPVTRNTNQGYYQQLSNRLNSNGNFPSAMLTKVKSMMTGFPSITDHQTDYSVRYYQQIVEADLLARLRNGYYGNGVELANRPEIYRMMLARTLANQYSQLLFIPVEFMTYFAFQYSPDGIGMSYLDDLKILNSMRAMTLFTHVMAQVNNSIPRTDVKLKLDPEDGDPWKTVEILAHEVVRSRQMNFPLGMNNPADITDWLQKASLKFSWENHPDMPDVGVEFQETNTNYVLPSTELMEFLNRQAILKTGLTPDTVDAALHTEFATSIVRNSIMLSKRITRNQRHFEPLMWDHMRKEMLAHGKFMQDLQQLLYDNFDEINVDVGLNRQSVRDGEQTVQNAVDKKDAKRFKDALKDDDTTKVDTTKQTQGNAGDSGESTTNDQDLSKVEQNQIPYAVVSRITKSDQQLDGKVKLSGAKEKGLDEYKKRYICEQIAKRFVLGIEAQLPRPETASEENLLAEVDAHGKLLDEVIEAWFSEKLFTDDTVGPEIAKSGEIIKNNIRALMMREFLMKQGIMTEMADIATVGEDGKPKLEMWDKLRSHLDAVIKPLTQVMADIRRTQKDVAVIFAKTDPAANPDDGGSTDDNSGGGDNGSGTGEPDFSMPGDDDADQNDTGSTDDTGAGGGEGEPTEAGDEGGGTDEAGKEGEGSPPENPDDENK